MERGQEIQSLGREEGEKDWEAACMSKEDAYLPSRRIPGIGSMCKKNSHHLRGLWGKPCPQGKATLEQGKKDVYRSTVPDSQVFQELLIHSRSRHPTPTCKGTLTAPLVGLRLLPSISQPTNQFSLLFISLLFLTSTR